MKLNLLDIFYFRNPLKTFFYNNIQIFSRIKHSKIRIYGRNNILQIDKNLNIKNLRIGISGNNNTIIFETKSKLHNFNISIQGDNQTITVGENCEILGANLLSCGENNSITIGKHCLIAGGVEMRNCDGHLILQNNEIINHPKKILIDNNVWIGADVTILKGTHIKCNTVIGIRSLVTAAYFEPNSIIAGIPAKTIKTNILWKR